MLLLAMHRNGEKVPQATAWQVQVLRRRCSLCAACVRQCAPGALMLRQERASITLVWDPGLCDGCGICVERCPEGAVRLVKPPQRDARGGRIVLMTGALCRCQACGAAFLPDKLRARVVHRSIASGVKSAVVARRAEQAYVYCPVCRWRMVEIGGDKDA